MSELVISPKGLVKENRNLLYTSNQLKGENKESFLAMHDYVSIRNEKPVMVKEQLILLINKSIFVSGFGGNWSEEEQELLYRTVINDIIRDFQNLTLKEIELAFHYGARERYFELFGLSVRSFYKWIECYVAENRKNALRASKLTKKIPVNTELTDEERKDIRHKWLETVCKEYESFVKDDKEWLFIDGSNLLYNYLIEHNILNLKVKSKHRLYNAAKAEYRKEYAESNNPTILRRRIKSSLNALKSLDGKGKNEPLSDDENIANERIKSIAKNLAIREFFTQCKKKGVNFEELIYAPIISK
jgi:hypothetical protein